MSLKRRDMNAISDWFCGSDRGVISMLAGSGAKQAASGRKDKRRRRRMSARCPRRCALSSRFCGVGLFWCEWCGGTTRQRNIVHQTPMKMEAVCGFWLTVLRSSTAWTAGSGVPDDRVFQTFHLNCDPRVQILDFNVSAVLDTKAILVAFTNPDVSRHCRQCYAFLSHWASSGSLIYESANYVGVVNCCGFFCQFGSVFTCGSEGNQDRMCGRTSA